MIDATGFDVGTSEAVLIVPRLHIFQSVQLHNHEHGQNREVFFGGSDVDTTDGFCLLAEEYLSVTIPAGKELWAISNHDTVDLRVLRVGK